MLETTNTTYATSEEFLQAITDVEVLIDETFIGSNLTAFLGNYQIPESDVSKYKFLENKKVFRQDGILTAAGGYDWFEAPVVMADALLEDMINAVNLNAPTSDYQRNWLRNIALDEPIKISTAENCTWNEDAPRPNLANQFEGDNFTLSTDSENSNDEIHQSVGTESAASYFTPTVGVLFATFATVAFLA